MIALVVSPAAATALQCTSSFTSAFCSSSPAVRAPFLPGRRVVVKSARISSQFLGGESLHKRIGTPADKGARKARVLEWNATLSDYATVTSVVYGLALLGGGTFAYLRTGSKGSIGGGVAGAGLLGLTYALLQNPEMSSNGEALGFGTSLLFTSLFAIRLAATKKPFPAGPLLALSAAATAVYASAYFT